MFACVLMASKATLALCMQQKQIHLRLYISPPRTRPKKKPIWFTLSHCCTRPLQIFFQQAYITAYKLTISWSWTLSFSGPRASRCVSSWVLSETYQILQRVLTGEESAALDKHTFCRHEEGRRIVIRSQVLSRHSWRLQVRKTTRQKDTPFP